jgi:hypothetical protein
MEVSPSRCQKDRDEWKEDQKVKRIFLKSSNKLVTIWGVCAALLLVATILPAASALETATPITVEIDPTTGSAESSVTLFSEDDLAATAAGLIFSSELALVSSASRQLARTPLGAKKVAQSILLNDYGFGEKEYKCLNTLWTKESKWNYKARNRNSGAHGIPQALPASKMNVVSTDWRTNPVTQIRWGLRYISIRYETPCKALAKHKRSNYY